MGRRNRKRKSTNSNGYDDDDDGDDEERYYELQKMKKRPTQSSVQMMDSSYGGKHVSQNDKVDQNDVDGGNRNGSSANATTTSPSMDENKPSAIETDDEAIKRQRLRKKRKKELQKQKKNLAAAKQKQEESIVREEKREQLALQQQRRDEKKHMKEMEKEQLMNFQFVTTHRGVQYCDIVVGNGPTVQDRKKVRVKYTLRAKNKTGKVLDSSSNFGFRMGKGEVIPGWEIGLLRMRQGGTRHLIVPPAAGYGNRNIGAGPGALLYFEITLLSC